MGLLSLLSGTGAFASVYPYPTGSGGTSGGGTGGASQTGTGGAGEADGGTAAPTSNGGCSFGGEGAASRITLGIGVGVIVLLHQRRRGRLRKPWCKP
jgi:hypothetical protein